MDPGLIYCQQIDGVNTRLNILDGVLKNASNASDQNELAIACELACLTLRMALEHLVLASLAANERAYSAIFSSTYTENYKAVKLLKRIETVNPNFYPTPVDIKKTENGGHISTVDEPYFGPKEFKKAYDECGYALHAQNPFGKGIDYEEYIRKIKIWIQLVRKLITQHVVELTNQSGFMLVIVDPENHAKHLYLLPHDDGSYIKTEDFRPSEI